MTAIIAPRIMITMVIAVVEAEETIMEREVEEKLLIDIKGVVILIEEMMIEIEDILDQL